MMHLESADPRTSVEEAFDLDIVTCPYEKHNRTENASIVKNVTLEEVFNACNSDIVVHEPSGYDHPDVTYKIIAYNYYLE